MAFSRPAVPSQAFGGGTATWLRDKKLFTSLGHRAIAERQDDAAQFVERHTGDCRQLGIGGKPAAAHPNAQRRPETLGPAPARNPPPAPAPARRVLQTRPPRPSG